MMALKELLVFAKHYDWYTTGKGGYIPTDKAPEEARKAMEIVNEKIKNAPEGAL